MALDCRYRPKLQLIQGLNLRLSLTSGLSGVVVLLLWVVHIVYWLVNINRSLKKYRRCFILSCLTLSISSFSSSSSSSSSPSFSPRYSPLFIIPVLQSTWILCTGDTQLQTITRPPFPRPFLRHLCSSAHLMSHPTLKITAAFLFLFHVL
jgi:hypothetical protein